MIGRILDNLIAPFAPAAALRRMVLRDALRTYQAADKSRRNQDWPGSNRSADAAIIPDSATINARARQMTRDSHIARAIQFAKVRNICGRGITPIPVATDAAGAELIDQNRAAERRFLEWANDPCRCDVEGRRTFWQFQALAVSEKVVVGELFVVWSYTQGIGFRLQAYEAEQLDPTIQDDAGNEVRGGVEVDANGKAVAYHFYLRNPSDLLFRKSLNSVRIPRERVLHFYRPDRVMQTRGVSELAPVLQRIRDVHRRDDAELMKAIMEACHGASIIRKRGRGGTGAPGLPRPAGDATGETPGGIKKFEYAPGMVFEGEEGDAVQFHSPTTPGNSFEPYTRQNLRGIGAGVDLSYEQINRDFSQGSWSTQRQQLLEDRRAWNPEQDLLTDILVSPVFNLWYRFEVLDGGFPLLPWSAFIVDPKRYTAAEYVVDGHEWVDPEKEVNAWGKAIELRLTTRKEIIGRRGGRYLQVLDQVEAERKAAAKRGITLPEDQLDTPPALAAPPSRPALPAPASAPPTGAATTDAGVVTDQTLNGAQITAAIDVMTRIRSGDIGNFAAVELLVAVGIERTNATKMTEEAKTLPPVATPAPAASPAVA